jgi:hypothetical protein
MSADESMAALPAMQIVAMAVVPGTGLAGLPCNGCLRDKVLCCNHESTALVRFKLAADDLLSQPSTSPPTITH